MSTIDVGPLTPTQVNSTHFDQRTGERRKTRECKRCVRAPTIVTKMIALTNIPKQSVNNLRSNLINVEPTKVS